MCPPFEIVGRGKKILASHRGHFEISENLIQYKIANTTIDFLVLYPTEGTGEFTELPPESNFDSYQILRRICGGSVEINFLPAESSSGRLDTVMNFIYGNILPFSSQKMGPGFYDLQTLHPNIYEEFYRLAEQQEDSITTTVATFNKNVFVPFKQRVIGTYHTDGEADEDKSASALEIIAKDFPRFLGLQQDLQTILYTQAKQISDYQSLSFSIISPLLRRFRMLNTLKDYLITERKKKGIEIKFNPKTFTIHEIFELLSPAVTPR